MKLEKWEVVAYIGLIPVFLLAVTVNILFLGLAYPVLVFASSLDEDFEKVNCRKPAKKPYYKNEFEEYQHYKHCSKK